MNQDDLMRQDFEQKKELQDLSSQSQEKMYAPQLKQQISDTQAAVIAQTNPATALKNVILGWQGYIISEDGEPEKIGEAIMNPFGIQRLASFLTPYVNDPTRFGNMKEEEVRRIIKQIANDVTEDIGFNWREYGIRNQSTKDLIVDAVIVLIWITLTRSTEQGEKNWLSKIVLESLSGGGSSQQKKRESSWQKYFKL